MILFSISGAFPLSSNSLTSTLETTRGQSQANQPLWLFVQVMANRSVANDLIGPSFNINVLPLFVESQLTHAGYSRPCCMLKPLDVSLLDRSCTSPPGPIM